MRALLDVNVLIALFDAGHALHDRAMAWLENQASGASGAALGTDYLKGMDPRSGRG
jgi:predicted nucleic acid-binding protein